MNDEETNPVARLARLSAGAAAACAVTVSAAWWFRQYLLTGGAFYTFDILSWSHWRSIPPHIAGWYSGQNELAVSLLLHLLAAPLAIGLAALAAAVFCSRRGFVVFRAPARLLAALTSCLWNILCFLLPFRVVRKKIQVPRVIFDDDDLIDHAPLPGLRSDAGAIEVAPHPSPASPAQRVGKPLEIDLSSPSHAPVPAAATPVSPQKVAAATEPGGGAKPGAGRTGNPLADLIDASATDDDPSGDAGNGSVESGQTSAPSQLPEGNRLSDSIPAAARTTANPADELQSQLRTWLDRNGWTALVDIWVDSSRILGNEAVRPVGRIPLVAMTSFEVFLLQIVDLEEQVWSTEDPADDPSWTAEDGRSMASPLAIASDNLMRFLTHHGPLLAELGSLDVQALTLTVNGDITDRDALLDAWEDQSGVLWTHVTAADLQEADALDELLGADFGEPVSVEERAPDKLVASLRRDSHDTAKIHDRPAA